MVPGLGCCAAATASIQQNASKQECAQAAKLHRMESAVRALLTGLGEDVDREGLRDTPKRVAKALLDVSQGYRKSAESVLGDAYFHEPIVDLGNQGMVLVRDIDFASTSEEDLLPFHGRCHIAYIPADGVVLGLSKLARLTKQIAKKLQSQTRLTMEIAAVLQKQLSCQGVAVLVQAKHLSILAPSNEQITACTSGQFAKPDSLLLQEFLALLEVDDLQQMDIQQLPDSWLGSSSSNDAFMHLGESVTGPCTPDVSEKDTDGDSDDVVMDSDGFDAMETAVQHLITEMGEDPHRPGLASCSRRYVMSLLASTSGYHRKLPLSKHTAKACCRATTTSTTTTAAAAAAPAETSKPPASAAPAAAHGAQDACPCCQGHTVVALGSHAACMHTAAHQQGSTSSASSTTSSTPSCSSSSSSSQQLRVTRHAFQSQCEHHMLPFYGTAVVAYLAEDEASEQSHGQCISHIVSMYTQRLQVQERITHQVADAVCEVLGAQGVMVVVDAAHMCMVARGVENHAGSTTTVATRGKLAGDLQLRQQALKACRERLKQS